MTEIAQNQIKIYEFPDCDDDEEESRQQKIMKVTFFFLFNDFNLLIITQKQK